MAKQKVLAVVLEDDSVRKVAVNDDNKLVDATTGEEVAYWKVRQYARLLQRQAADYEKWFLSICTLGEYLQAHNAQPEVEGGRIVALHFHPNIEWDDGKWGDGKWGEPYEPSAEQYERLRLDPADLGCVEPHPEGADRGGYVPMLNNGCHYDESSCEWQG